MVVSPSAGATTSSSHLVAPKRQEKGKGAAGGSEVAGDPVGRPEIDGSPCTDTNVMTGPMDSFSVY
jgi:hypothetical protein